MLTKAEAEHIRIAADRVSLADATLAAIIAANAPDAEERIKQARCNANAMHQRFLNVLREYTQEPSESDTTPTG